jgi:hypothetical protein
LYESRGSGKEAERLRQRIKTGRRISGFANE